MGFTNRSLRRSAVAARATATVTHLHHLIGAASRYKCVMGVSTTLAQSMIRIQQLSISLVSMDFSDGNGPPNKRLKLAEPLPNDPGWHLDVRRDRLSFVIISA